LIMAAGQIAGKIAGDRAKGRAAEANINADRDRLAAQQNIAQQDAMLKAASLKESGTMDRAALELQRKAYADAAPMSRYKQALLGSLAANARDVSASRPAGVPNISFGGGLRPSAIGPTGRAAGEAMAAQAMLRLLKGDQFSDVGAAPDPKVLSPTSLSPLPKSNILDRILGGLSVAGMAAGAYNLSQGGGAGSASSDAMSGVNAPMPTTQPAPVLPQLMAAGESNGVPESLAAALIRRNAQFGG
jgi:hypothetical protein